MSEPISIAAAASGAATSVVSNVLDAFAKSFSQNAGRVTRGIAERTVSALQLGFHEYLVTSYNKCRFFKTILNPQQPIPVKSHYVHVDLSCNGKTISDDQLILNASSYERVVVTGLAGSGKSMFMKYITVCLFEEPRGIIPLFVELRHLNSMSKPDLLTFIRSSCASRLHNVSVSQFELSLRSGTLMLILDGFDELNHEIRGTVEKQILDLEKDFPKATIVISSRPDERFGSWRSFYVFKVDRLTKEQSISLIQGLDYNPGVKRRFLKEVSSRLYASHESFLSSPLLTSIMLLTYEEFAEIPQKMHAFYGQAFDTLFQKHDAQKDQYQRKTNSSLTREDFRKAFSVFSAMSYLDEKFSFSDETLHHTADRAVSYLKQLTTSAPNQLTGKQLVDDLFESVCMLQRDGTESAFVHRSFQEYFAAVFAQNLPSQKLKNLLDRYSLRFSDSVLPMLFDMSQGVVENDWVLPTLDELEQRIGLLDETSNSGDKMAKIFARVRLSHHVDGVYLYTFEQNAGILGSLETICSMYPKSLGSVMFIRPFDDITVKLLDTLVAPENSHLRNFDKLMELQKLRPEGVSDQKFVPNTTPIQFDLASEDYWWLDKLGFSLMLEKMKKGFSAIRKDILSREQKMSNILEDFL